MAFVAGWLAVAGSEASAQEAPPPPAVDAPGAAPATTSHIVLPALTPLRVRLEETISSKSNKPGDHFRISIAEDVRIADAIVIPAGSQGVGEVVHAAPSGSGGKPGALILAARTAEVNGRQVRLRSLVLGRSGTDRTSGVGIAAAAVGILALPVHGGEVVIPAGTMADARTAEAFEVPSVPAASPSQAGSAADPTGGNDHEQH